MSLGEDIQVAYYSTLLAKAVKECDGDAFTDLWDRINLVANKQEAQNAKDRAYELSSNASVFILDKKLAWLESHGVKPLPSKPKHLEEVAEIKAEISTSDRDTVDRYTGVCATGQISGDQVGITASPFTGQKERSLVEIYNKTQMENYQKNPFDDRNLSFFDGADDETTPLLNKRPGQINAKKNHGSVNNNVDYVTINMPTEVDSNIDFNLYRKKSPLNTFNNYFEPTSSGNSFEMTDMERSNWNKNEEMNLQSAEESDEDLENKKSKKRKKRKSKGQVLPDTQETKEVEANENNDEKAMKSSRNIRRKKLKEEARKISAPLNDTNNNVKPAAEKKKKKMTVKQYKEEKARKNSAGQRSEEKKKQEERNCRPADVLDDEMVAKILKSLGDPAEMVTEMKKKSNKEKTVSGKKEKKKGKKSKKVSDEDKKTEVKEHEIVKEKSSKESHVEKNSVEMNFNDENTDEFVTQQRRPRRVANNKAPAFSGRTSPTHTGVRKRRFSDPSPSVTKTVPGSKSEATTSYETRELSDGQDWPSLTSSLAEIGGASKTLSRASYASKLKSNLDSTGCSLASSSEDGGSSSSSSSNFPSCVAADLDINMPSHMVKVVSSVTAATADLLKCLTHAATTMGDGSSEKDKKSGKENKVGGRDAKPDDSNKSSADRTPRKAAEKSSGSSAVEKEPSLNEEPASITQTDKARNTVANKSADDMEAIVKNEWGLDFFMTDEQSLSAPAFNIDIDMLDKGDFELTFGDDVIMEIPSVEPPRLITDDVLSIKSTPSNWNDAGDFNLSAAAKFLNKEWQSSLAKGTFYE